MQISADLIHILVGQICWLRYICKIFFSSSSFKLVIQNGNKSTRGDKKFAKKIICMKSSCTSFSDILSLHTSLYKKNRVLENRKYKGKTLTYNEFDKKKAYLELTHRLSLVKDLSPWPSNSIDLFL